MDHSTPGFPVHHQLPELAQTNVHPTASSSVSPSPPALNLSQHQGLFQWVNSSHQVDKVLELQVDKVLELQHQSFLWIVWVYFLWDWLVWSPCSPRDCQESSLTPQFKVKVLVAQFSSVTQSCPTLRPHELQHARSPCPSPTPRVHPNSCPSSQWCHPAISSSLTLIFTEDEISLQSKGLSRVFSNTTVQKHQFFSAQLSSQSNSYIRTWPQEKP